MQMYTCPACAWPGLADPPRTTQSGGSFEVCPSCGIQFGYSDENSGDGAGRTSYYRGWGVKWYTEGARWSGSQPAPEGWDGKAQFAHRDAAGK